ncbi:unnamed protein product [Callosobruchus maculatus]|uniref:Peptidase C19 ubiquitin carboxyl-terminal hydrolase domain-containing protein n=1 Tax=Callosobruchus maculatus TaxID=64391 RepID=A0A653CJA2_CALMS|nr:unnamed protein product [Callosobruchus maculatus]
MQCRSDDALNPDRLYDLVAVVIHCGSGPNRGHYISIVKKIDASTIEDFYGLTADTQNPLRLVIFSSIRAVRAYEASLDLP